MASLDSGWIPSAGDALPVAAAATMANAAAANNVTNWGGTCYITPLIGAFLADAYLGRFWTIAGASVVYQFVRTRTRVPHVDDDDAHTKQS